jgi:hypothetical protein
VDENKQPLIWVILLALLGVGMPWLVSPSQRASQGASDRAEVAEPPRSAEKPPTSCDTMRDVLQKRRRDVGPGASADARTIIATVPDPNDSVLDYGFDRTVDAIRRAAGAAGYQLERYSLPWRAGPGDANAKEGLEPLWRQVPGWLLFRGSSALGSASPELLQVLLVGETAAWGVHGEAFDCALQVAAADDWRIRLAGPTFSGTAGSIRRGIERFSCDGTRDVQKKWGRTLSVAVQNGSATSPAVKSVLQRETALLDCGSREAEVTLEITYGATVADDAQVLEAFTRHMVEDLELLDHSRRDRLLGSPGTCFVKEMGILVESGSAYGSGVSDPRGAGGGKSAEVSCNNAECCVPQGKVCRWKVPPTRECEAYVPVLQVQYPAHVARVRTEHQRQRKMLGAKHDGEQGAPQRALELSMERREDPAELLPPLSPKSAYSDDLALSHAIQEMCRQEMRWIGIMGTDTIDRLFLAHEVRTLCPNVRLFFLESDIFYAHPDYAGVLDGSLVLSSYPLLPQNRAWTSPFDAFTVDQPGSSGALGVHNAVAELLGHPAARREDARPFVKTPREGAGPVWVTAVGNGSFWPVAALDGGTRQASPQLDIWKPDTWKEGVWVGVDARWYFNSTGQWVFFVSLAVAAGAVVAAGYWAARLRTSGAHLPPGLRWAEVFPGKDHRSPGQGAFAFAAVAPVTAVLWLVLWTAFVERIVLIKDFKDALGRSLLANVWQVCAVDAFSGGISVEGVWQAAKRLPALLVGASLALAMLDALVHPLLVWLYSRDRPLETGVRRRLLLVEVGLLAAIFAAVGRFDGIHPLESSTLSGVTDALLFRERNGNLSSGLSVLVPAFIVAGALFLGGYSNLLRLSAAPGRGARAGVEAPDSGLEHGQIARGRQLLNPLSFKAGRLGGGVWPVVAAGSVMVIVYNRFDGRIGLLEPSAWDRALTCAALLVCGLAAAAYVGFVLGWRRLRATLVRLAASPFAASFDRVPAEHVAQLGGLLLARPPDIVALGATVGRWKTMVAALRGGGAESGLPEEQRAALARALEDPEELLVTYEKELASGVAPRDATLSDTYRAMWRRVERAAGVLAGVEGATLPLAHHGTAPAGKEEKGSSGQGAEAIVAVHDMLATLVTLRVFHALRRLRWMLSLATATPLLLLMMVVSYPFEARSSLLLAVQGEMVLVIGTSIALFVDMDRNDVLSRIHGTTSGQLNFTWTLAIKLLLFAIVPILTMVAADIPAVGQVMFGWMVPVLQQMK